MALPYNLTAIENTSNLYTYFVEVNKLTTGWFAYMLLISLFIMLFAAWQHRDKKAAVIGSSFITTIVAILLWAVGFISATIIIFPLLLLLGGIFVKLFSGD